ncbi:MAG: peptide chain release factor N(5)-glutamine methyltransferase [Candidatus Omnitrophica bacterium]|nr:peptide chain release factor N(5)-glutamine methyltransferase [Candidatus Omnitrophota bacterium]
MNETELLFTEALNCDRLSLYLNKAQALKKERSVFISSVLKRRCIGEPIQYILGRADFMGLEFKVSPVVLIPRPETEILVTKVIDMATSHQSLKILDIGTGSGCIAVSLAKYLPGARLDALDVSQEALEIAKQNAILNNVTVNFIHSDLFNNFQRPEAKYDIIISNPPYIPTSEIDMLAPEVQYEPRMSLDGGRDGLDFYRRIIGLSPDHLKSSGILIMEIGFTQAGPVRNIFNKSGKFEIIDVASDYNDIERVIVARKA